MPTKPACALVVAIASPICCADDIEYVFDFTITLNAITSGPYSSLQPGDTLSLRYIIDKNIQPTTTNPTFQLWESTDLIKSIEITTDSYDQSFINPFTYSQIDNDTPIGNDHYRDKISLFTPGLPLTDVDPFVFEVILQSDLPTNPAPTSLVGLDFPSKQSELDLSTFQYSSFSVQSISDILLAAEMTAARVVPTPATTFCIAAALAVPRRRRD